MRVLRIAAWVVVALLAVVIAASFHPAVQNVYRALRPSTSYDTVAPEVPDLAAPAVLVFSKTNGFRHADAIEVGSEALAQIAARRNWGLFHTENGAVFDSAILSRFQAVVWLNASGAPLDTAQREALRAWIEAGGGFVGVHAALDGSHSSWEWYRRNVVGAGFIGHALGILPATVQVEQLQHPATKHLETEWRREDEWYSFDRSVRGDPGVEVLATLDESTYEPRMRLLWIDQDLSMGDHPILWTRSVGRGQAFLSALGHSGDSFREAAYLAVLEGAIEWSARLVDQDARMTDEP